jgi:Transposase
MSILAFTNLMNLLNLKLLTIMPHYDIATKALVVTLKASQKATIEISGLTGLIPRTIDRIYATAVDRGFDPAVRPLVIRDEFVADKKRTGRPSKRTSVEELIISMVRRDRYGREKSCADIAGEISEKGVQVSATTVWRMLRKNGFRKTKPTRKPGLTQKMRSERLKWCLDRQHWSLDDWKNVIWSDETSVVLLHRRGGYRLWRQPEEKVNKSVIRPRWKGSSEFMFWGSFSYDKKGPCHCWCPETLAEKRLAEEEIDSLNKALEPAAKLAWELEQGVRRIHLRRNLPGRKPQWRFTKKTGKLVRDTKGGIDWWRYRKVILTPMLLPFAKECLRERPGTLVQEDKAPAHIHFFQQSLFTESGVERLLWCGNSPDLNAIEVAWPWMKRYTTKKGAPQSRSEAIAKWLAAWEAMPQEAIQRWIERIPRHVAEIIKLEGGNEYVEGRGTVS